MSLESSGFDGTELTLGLPGTSDGRPKSSGTKRGFPVTVDLNLGNYGDKVAGISNSDISSVAESPMPKTRVVGWPPVSTTREIATRGRKYVKVAVEGAAYLRKVDLESYTCYEQLLRALEDMFSGLTIRYYLNESNLLEMGKRREEYVPTYEDKDGDWMLVGDVPWKMFVESCRRLRLMKSGDAMGLAPTTSRG